MLLAHSYQPAEVLANPLTTNFQIFKEMEIKEAVNFYNDRVKFSNVKPMRKTLGFALCVCLLASWAPNTK